MNLKHLSDEFLIKSTESIVRESREIVTRLLHHLREIERRRLYSSLKYKSIWDYVVRGLGFTEDEAYLRISAMRLLQELPEMEEKIESGKISLTHINIAQRLFRSEPDQFSKSEKIEILAQLESTSKRDAEKITLAMSSSPIQLTERIRPIANDMIELRFVANVQLELKIQKLKGLLAHSKPRISLADLIDTLCDYGLDKLDPARKAKADSRTDAKTEETANAMSPVLERDAALRSREYLPSDLKRKVWKRDKSSCTNCGSIFALEIDHIEPVAKGGSNKLENLRLLCRSCNQRMAIESFGQEQMEIFLN